MEANSRIPDIAHDERLRDFYTGRRVLVVGPDGFLGSNCVQALRGLGADLSLLSRREGARVGGCGRIFLGHLEDETTVRAATEGQEIVFDFAGTSGAVQSNRDPYRHLKDECHPQLILFRSCALTDPRPVVMFCSSRLVYGKPQYLPVDEDHPLDPQSFYAVHKLTLERYLRVLAHTQGLPYCVLRLSNPFGPHFAAEPRGYGIINQFIRLAFRGEPITIYGDGSQQRDYVHVNDVLTAFFACAMLEGCHGQTFNFGGRAAIRLRDAAELIANAAGGTPIRFVSWPREEKSVETGDYRSDMSKLDRFVSLPPQRSFGEGVFMTMEALACDPAMSRVGGAAVGRTTRISGAGT